MFQLMSAEMTLKMCWGFKPMEPQCTHIEYGGASVIKEMTQGTEVGDEISVMAEKSVQVIWLKSARGRAWGKGEFVSRLLGLLILRCRTTQPAILDSLSELYRTRGQIHMCHFRISAGQWKRSRIIEELLM